MVPGSPELAAATAKELQRFDACVWQLHGIIASGDDFDAAFGLVEAVNKAADVLLRVWSAQNGNPVAPFSLNDDDLRATAAAYNLPINEEFLG